MPAKHREMSKTDSALAFANLAEVRKFGQVVTSVLSVAKGKEAQGAIGVSKTLLAVKEMVWWWGIKVDRIGIALKLHTIYTLADLFPRTCWRWEGWRKRKMEKNGREKKRWRTETNCKAMPIWSMSWGITLAWHHLILLFDRGTFAWTGYSGEIWRAKGTFIKGTEGNCQLTFPHSWVFQ